MNRLTFSAIIAAILILPLGTSAALAQERNNNFEKNSTMERSHHKHNRKRGMGGKIDKLVQKLDLTSEQSERVKAIAEQSKTESQALFEQLQTNRQEMQSLLASDADPEQLRANHQNVQSLRQELGNSRFETMLEIREVLTSEQRVEMAELMGRRGRKFDN